MAMEPRSPAPARFLRQPIGARPVLTAGCAPAPIIVAAFRFAAAGRPAITKMEARPPVRFPAAANIPAVHTALATNLDGAHLGRGSLELCAGEGSVATFATSPH